MGQLFTLLPGLNSLPHPLTHVFIPEALRFEDLGIPRCRFSSGISLPETKLRRRFRCGRELLTVWWVGTQHLPSFK